MKILVINSGSSSVKFQLYKMPDESLLASGIVEKKGKGDSAMKGFFGDKNVIFHNKRFSVRDALESILGEFINENNKCLQSLDEIDVVGHRLIHGSEEERSCVEISGSLLTYMQSCISLAPLHYPANIEGIRMAGELLPHAIQTGVFDTAFHHSLPEKAFLYGISLKWYQQHQIRRYGFHGTSHKYVSKRACEIAGLAFSESKIISCHLGNGASVTAVKNGKSVDTSMGMTPVEGLLMGTRCGDIDAGVLIYLQEQLHLSLEEIQKEINTSSGLLGLSGVSSDYRDVYQAAQNGNNDARTALDVYYYRIKKYIGAYAAALGGFDLLVFTGGVGENSAETRQKACEDLEFLGIQLSAKKNIEMNGKEAEISSRHSKVKVVIVPANEELIIAREAFEFTKTKQNDLNSY